ncbi:MAG: RnfABCDGE type electron transport complex subunit D, partial [Saprospiraceae bacterium]|nr:RnfABCDGE type electron transport complex subunit D [Saprospiraceae bacterium]
MSKILKFVKKLEPKKGTFAHTLYDGFFTFLFTPDEVTHGGTHIKDGMDLKRTMVFVVFALIPAYLFGMYNIGQ